MAARPCSFFYLIPRDLVGSGVHLGNDQVLSILVLLGQLVPDGLQLLAVSYTVVIERKKQNQIKITFFYEAASALPLRYPAKSSIRIVL